MNNLKDIGEIIGNVDLFRTLEKEEVDLISRIAKIERISKGDIIFSQGDTNDSFLIIIDGKVEITKDIGGGRRRFLASVEKGGILGEISMFDNAPCSANVIASTECSLIKFNREEFLNFLFSHPNIGVKIYHCIVETLCKRLRKAGEKITEGIMWGFQFQV